MDSQEQKDNLTETIREYEKGKQDFKKRKSALNVKAGSPNEITSSKGPGDFDRVSVGAAKPVSSGNYSSSKTFVSAMEEGLSVEEANQNLLDSPAYKKANSETLGGRIQELGVKFRLMMVQIWLPDNYQVVRKQQMLDAREFLVKARELWQSYEPLLGGRNTTSVLQVDAPDIQPDEEEISNA